MPYAQVYLTKQEYAEMHLFRFKKNWTVRKLLKRSLLEYIRKPHEKIDNPEVTKEGDSNE